jgi:predicted esterase
MARFCGPDHEQLRAIMSFVSEPAPPHQQPAENSRHGRLAVRLYQPVTASTTTGLLRFDGPTGELVALAYVPAPADGRTYRLVLLLHGAGASPRQGLDLLLSAADEHRLLIVAPKSVSGTWDLIVDGFGPDVRRLDRVLEEVLDSHPVERIAIGGFSDGASYGLSIGLTNGDLFDTVLAFSPGFAAPLVLHGQPRVFVSHGTGDRVLPIDACSRQLVPRLRAMDYPVTYEEFDGGHEVPGQVVDLAVSYMLSGTGSVQVR